MQGVRDYPEGMGKTWVLKTETKGTGATMVPLESTTQRSAPTEPVFVPREPAPRAETAPEPPAPRPVDEAMLRAAFALST